MDVLYCHDNEYRIEFEYLWDYAKPIQVKDTKSDKEYRGTAIKFSASIELRDQLTSEVVSLKYELLDNTDTSLSVGMKKEAKGYKIQAEGYDLIRTTGRPWDVGQPARFYGFPETAVAYHQNADFLQTLNLEHERMFGSLYYLGPLRIKPQRLYTWSGSEPDSVGISGENTVFAILAAKKRRLNMRRKTHTKLFGEIVAEKLFSMGLIEEFMLRPIAKERQTYEVKVRTKGSSDLVDLPDVGFGISQVLPVIVQLFYAPAKSIIIMEQPEIHLHPRAQALLADVMIDAIKATENGNERGIQLIVETHSEHFLRRLQRRIAEDVISKEQIAAYFANAGNTPTTLEALEIDTFGNISNWPENFFGDDMDDIAAQSTAALEKRMREDNP